MRRVRGRNSRTAMISPWRSRRDIRRALGNVRYYRVPSVESPVNAVRSNTFCHVFTRARARTDSRLEIRKREIASRGDTHGGLKLCRYRRVARPGRGQGPSFLLLARATARIACLFLKYTVSSFILSDSWRLLRVKRYYERENNFMRKTR